MSNNIKYFSATQGDYQYDPNLRIRPIESFDLPPETTEVTIYRNRGSIGSVDPDVRQFTVEVDRSTYAVIYSPNPIKVFLHSVSRLSELRILNFRLHLMLENYDKPDDYFNWDKQKQPRFTHLCSGYLPSKTFTRGLEQILLLDHPIPEPDQLPESLRVLIFNYDDVYSFDVASCEEFLSIPHTVPDTEYEDYVNFVDEYKPFIEALFLNLPNLMRIASNIP